jgi:HK97 family phage portal protein
MLSGLFGRETETRSALTDVDWWGDVGTTTYAGVRVSTESSLQLLTVYGCVRLISDSISTLPVDVYRKDGDTAVPAPMPEWLRMPTPTLDFTAWATQMLSSLLLSGNAYAWVARSDTAGILSVTPLDPAKVAVEREKGRKVFLVDGVVRRDAEILHVPGLMLPGSDVGMNPIEYARQSIGLGLSALEYGSKFFDGEGNMPGVIETPGDMQPEKIRQLASQWRAKRSRKGKGLPGVLHSGATWKPTGVTNEQAQFLATRQYTAAEIAGQMFLIDPSELGIPVQGTSLTYANLEDRNARLVRVSLLPWIVRLERALSDLLARPRYVKLQTSGLLRGDVTSRFNAYQIGISSKFMTPNEARKFEDWSPLPGGDEVVEVAPAPPTPQEGEDDAA